MIDNSERGREIAKEISNARKMLELVEAFDHDFMKQYEHAVILHAASLSILTKLQYWNGYQLGGANTAAIYRRDK